GSVAVAATGGVVAAGGVIGRLGAAERGSVRTGRADGSIPGPVGAGSSVVAEVGQVAHATPPHRTRSASCLAQSPWSPTTGLPQTAALVPAPLPSPTRGRLGMVTGQVVMTPPSRARGCVSARPTATPAVPWRARG